jgi:hypothetical protein
VFTMTSRRRCTQVACAKLAAELEQHARAIGVRQPDGDRALAEHDAMRVVVRESRAGRRCR